ncbi:MAG: TetR/AcrR family transcriptional regulator [Candidatus Dormibacteraeota bacterium]|nr:TetR/AcrR family transcriptional regulator [Candidatus Dormibacteraeota bacterium]
MDPPICGSAPAVVGAVSEAPPSRRPRRAPKQQPSPPPKPGSRANQGSRPYGGESLEDRRIDQRRRLMFSARDVFAERGYLAASVEEIVARAHVSRTAFYRFFESKEDCLVAVYRDGVDRALLQFRAIGTSDLDAVEKVNSAAATIIRFFGEDPALARVMLIEVVGASPATQAVRHQARLEFARIVEDAMAATGLWNKRPKRERELVAVATMAAMVETVSHLVAAGRIGEWQSLVDPMGRYALRALTPEA